MGRPYCPNCPAKKPSKVVRAKILKPLDPNFGFDGWMCPQCSDRFELDDATLLFYAPAKPLDASTWARLVNWKTHDEPPQPVQVLPRKSQTTTYYFPPSHEYPQTVLPVRPPLSLIEYLGLESPGSPAKEELAPAEGALTEADPTPEPASEMPLETEEDAQRRERLMRIVESPLPEQLASPPQPPAEDHPPVSPSPPKIPMPPDDSATFHSYATKISARLEDVLAKSPFAAAIRTPSAAGSKVNSPGGSNSGSGSASGGGGGGGGGPGDPDVPIGPDADDAMRMFGEAPGTRLPLPAPPAPFVKSPRLVALEAEVAAIKSPRIALEAELAARAASPRVKSPPMQALERDLEAMGLPSGAIKRDQSSDRDGYDRSMAAHASPTFYASPTHASLVYPAYSASNRNIDPTSPGWGSDPNLVGDSARAKRRAAWGSDTGSRKNAEAKKEGSGVGANSLSKAPSIAPSNAPSRAPSTPSTPKSREMAGLNAVQASLLMPAGIECDGKVMSDVVQRAREAAVAEKEAIEREEQREKEKGDVADKEAAQVVQRAREAAMAEKSDKEVREQEVKLEKDAAMAQEVANRLMKKKSALKGKGKHKAASDIGKASSSSIAAPMAAAAAVEVPPALFTSASANTTDAKPSTSSPSFPAPTLRPPIKSSLSTCSIPTLKSAMKRGSTTKATSTTGTSMDTATAAEPPRRQTAASISAKINELVRPGRHSHHVETGWGSPLMGF